VYTNLSTLLYPTRIAMAVVADSVFFRRPALEAGDQLSYRTLLEDFGHSARSVA
jgi:hypothetical protein